MMIVQADVGLSVVYDGRSWLWRFYTMYANKEVDIIVEWY